MQRDVPPLKASKYVSPRLGIVRAGNGLYWQFGLIRAEKSNVEAAGSASLNAADDDIGRRGSSSAKSTSTSLLGSEAAGAGSINRRDDVGAPSPRDGGISTGRSIPPTVSESCTVVSRCQDNMEGAMPKWVMSVMASKGAPTYVNTLQVIERV